MASAASKGKTGLAAIGVAMVMAWPAPAGALGGANPPPQAQANCMNAVNTQTDNKVGAGGGPKLGFYGPTNCDHYYQVNGYIGQGK